MIQNNVELFNISIYHEHEKHEVLFFLGFVFFKHLFHIQLLYEGNKNSLQTFTLHPPKKIVSA